jgi:hypothetical protein
MRLDMMSSTTMRAAMKVMMNPNKARRASGAGATRIGAGAASGAEARGVGMRGCLTIFVSKVY